MQEKLLKSVRAAQTLDADRMFNAILTDKGLQDFILDMNKEQLFAGEDSLGVSLESIGGGYSAFTIEVKQKKGQPTDRVTLKDTGEYYDSYTLDLGNGFFTINSDPIKGDTNLETEWGDNLEGLQDENLQKLIEIIRVKFEQETRRVLAA